jgi:lauroyl/myristoyl acyltransferase
VTAAARARERLADLEDLARLRYALLKQAVRWIVDRGERRRAIAIAELVLRDTGRTDAVAVARRRLRGRTLAQIHLARPGLLRRVRVEGWHHVDAANEGGRGIVVPTLHSDAMWLPLELFARTGQPIAQIAGEWMLREGDVHGGDAHTRRLDAAGVDVVPVHDAGELLLDALRTGSWCPITVDVPGREAVRIMGKTARIKTGFAGLARVAGVPLVPVVVYWDGSVPVVEALPAIDPADHRGRRALAHAVVEALDRQMQARPEIWAPFTSGLWPEHLREYKWAFDGEPGPPAPTREERS